MIELEILCAKGWVCPPLLAEPELIRAMNAAAVLKASVIKCAGLDFAEGARVRLVEDGAEVFSGRVFTKERRRTEVIEITAYDELRYFQNRDCCVFASMSAAAIVKQIAVSLGLECGDLAAVEWKSGVSVYDNKRYIDMVGDVLAEILAQRGRQYVLLAEGGKVCLRAARDMQSDVLLDLSSFAGYCYRTTIDEGYANRVKLVYEDKRKGRRQEFVAEDEQGIARCGVLQYFHKSAAVVQESMGSARAKLKNLAVRGEKLQVSGAIGEVAIRGGSIIWLRLDLGDKIVDCEAIVLRARHYYSCGRWLMDLDLEVLE